MRIRGLCKSYQVAGRRVEVLSALDLDVDDHEITVVLGRSGCGKTTLLRLVAGLEKADSGGVEPTNCGVVEPTNSGTVEPTNCGAVEPTNCGAVELTHSGTVEPANCGAVEPTNHGAVEQADNGAVRQEFETPGGRGGLPKMGVIFQEPRLMPWLTIGDNILFGTGERMKKNEPEDSKLGRLLDLTGLRGFERAYPSQLSGGMQQRAALARALAYEPDYLLMDEPFAALDYFTRRQMQQELLRIYETEKKGILFVTHSIDEALTIGRKIVILERGGCRREYSLDQLSYPRDLLSGNVLEIKREIIKEIEKGGEKDEN